MSDTTMNEALADDQAFAESYLDISMKDIVHEQAVEAGEYELTVLQAGIGKSNKPGAEPYLRVRFELSDVVGAKDVMHFMMLPNEEKGKKSFERRRADIADFFEAVGIKDEDQTRYPLSELTGLTCWAVLRVEESEEYGEQNRIVSFTTGA